MVLYCKYINNSYQPLLTKSLYKKVSSPHRPFGLTLSFPYQKLGALLKSQNWQKKVPGLSSSFPPLILLTQSCPSLLSQGFTLSLTQNDALGNDSAFTKHCSSKLEETPKSLSTWHMKQGLVTALGPYHYGTEWNSYFVPWDCLSSQVKKLVVFLHFPHEVPFCMPRFQR